MARPPRIPVMLPWECKVIYFITLCIVPRCEALANDAAWKAVCETLGRLGPVEYVLHHDDARSHSLAHCAEPARAERCCFSEMVQALVQRIIPCTRKMAMAAGRL